VSVKDLDDVKMCNCAQCGKELLGRSMLGWYNELSLANQRRYPPPCAGYIDLRPYCSFHFRLHQRFFPACLISETNLATPVIDLPPTSKEILCESGTSNS
jgi:hypothetical protein